MADTTSDQIAFTHKELAETLIKAQGIHEGIWGLYVEFRLAAGNAGPDEEHISPTAFVIIEKIGLQKFAKESGLSVDAAKVNPAQKPSAKRLPGR